MAKDLCTMVTGKRLGHPVRSLRTKFTREYSKTEFGELLQECSDPEELADYDVDKLIKLLEKENRGRHSREKAEELKAKASRSVGTRFGRDALKFWWNVAVLSLSVHSLAKRLLLPGKVRSCRPKTLRFLFYTSIYSDGRASCRERV